MKGDFVGGLVSTGDIVLSEGDTRVDLITLDGIWDVIASEADTDYAYLGPTGATCDTKPTKRQALLLVFPIRLYPSNLTFCDSKLISVIY